MREGFDIVVRRSHGRNVAANCLAHHAVEIAAVMSFHRIRAVTASSVFKSAPSVGDEHRSIERGCNGLVQGRQLIRTMDQVQDV